MNQTPRYSALIIVIIGLLSGTGCMATYGANGQLEYSGYETQVPVQPPPPPPPAVAVEPPPVVVVEPPPVFVPPPCYNCGPSYPPPRCHTCQLPPPPPPCYSCQLPPPPCYRGWGRCR